MAAEECVYTMPSARSASSVTASASIMARKRRDSSSRMVCLTLSMGSAIGDAVFEDADLVDLDLHLVAGLHPERRRAARAHAAWRSRHQHVAGQQRGPGGDVLDDLGDLENHLLGGGVLHAL